jgi:glucose/arabinose dehydrogenase
VVALGLRNPWRFSFDRATGDLYVGDVGASRWEEIDYVRRGAARPHNFGWPAYEGRVRRAATSPPLDPAPTPPLFVYRHAARGCSSVVGGYVYRGRRVSALKGRYLFADFCSGEIRSLRVARGKASDVRTELSRRLPGLLSSFGEDTRGELYAFAYTYKLSTLYRLDEAG